MQPRENFVRGPVWIAEVARQQWESKLRRAVDFWNTVERESVGTIRSSALLIATPDKLVALSSWAASANKQLTILAGDRDLRVVVHLPSAQLSKAWMDAWEVGDNTRIGELLGYPACCQKFFARTWEEGARDTTLQQYEGAGTADGPIGCNLLLRWLGVRLIPHLACSYTCSESAAMAEKFMLLGEKLGDRAGLTASVELLSMPYAFSSLHGTGEVMNSFFKLEFDTDPLAEKRSFTRAQVPVIKREVLSTTYEDNGFVSREAMQNSHMIIGSVTPRNAGGAVIDLGCGDGTLLEKLRTRDTLTSAIGIEADGEKVKRGKQRYPLVTFVAGHIEETLNSALVQPKTTVLFMPGRLLEMEASVADRVREWVMGFDNIVLYTYGDYGDLTGLCERTRMPIPKHIVRSHGGSTEAGLIKRG